MLWEIPKCDLFRIDHITIAWTLHDDLAMHIATLLLDNFTVIGNKRLDDLQFAIDGIATDQSL